MLVDGIGGHSGDVLRRLGLDVEGDERVRHQVVDRLEPLLPNKVLPIVEQPVVEGLMAKPGHHRTREDQIGRCVRFFTAGRCCQHLRAKVWVPGCRWLSLIR